jgi:hypothetical protein
MSWDRSQAAKALASLLGETATAAGSLASVFDRPQATVNPPALIVAYADVQFSTAAFSIDEADLIVTCVAPWGGEDASDDLVGLVRTTVADHPTLDGAVQICDATATRNWRNATVAGVDVLLADVVLHILM